MRMVSKLHVSPNSVKRFKKVHVAHKMYAAHKNPVETVKEPVVLQEPEVVPEPVVEEEVPTPKKSFKKKKVEETYIENNEENTESHE